MNSKAMLWTGRAMGWLPTLFLLLDGAMKLVKPAVVVKATIELGYSESSIVGIGNALLASILCLIPQTSVLGAILLSGYLDGAVATHVRVGHGAFEILFPVVFGVLLWSGLCLRDRRLLALVSIRTCGSPAATSKEFSR